MIDSGLADVITVRHAASLNAIGHAEYTFRGPDAEDASTIHDLIASCPPLDPNSLYCNLLQCTHFADTCLVAEHDGVIAGWISGYRPADEPQAMFVWQIAVHERARGRGLALGMLNALLCRPAVADAQRLITTVTPSNRTSRRMFANFARQHEADMVVSPWFDGETHFGGGHESEELISIGPLRSLLTEKSNRKEN